jgi:hypothetical protein
MRIADIKKVAERQPFRPFIVRLSNGAEYEFKEPRDFAAPRNYRSIIHFDEDDWALIDADNITEIIDR